MEEKKKALLEAIGVDIPAAKERFMGNGELYFRFLYKIVDHPQFDELKKAFQAGDKRQALTMSHNLKSLTGNLSLIKLHGLLAAQVIKLREDDWDSALATLDDIIAEYERIVGLLNE